MNNYRNFILPFWALMVLIFSITACNSSTEQNENSDADGTAMGDTTGTANYSDDQSRQLHGDVIGGEEGFIYSYADEPYYENDAAVENAQRDKATAEKVSTKTGKLNTEKKMPKVKAEPVVYRVSQTDRPPLFASKCLTDKDPADCSSDALKDWVREYIEYPDNALLKNQEGVQYVTFIINQRGSISTITNVDSKGQLCDGCSSAAVDAVANMPDWQPAMKNGKPVSVVVTLPIRFKVI